MNFHLNPLDLHVWRVELDRPPTEIERLAACLSAEERQRAERFLRDIDRSRYIVSHAAVRSILGQYLNVPPSQITTAVRAGGKPELANSPLRYNLSHSKALAMMAIAIDREVGVDVEHVRPMVDAEGIMGRYFAPGERAAWLALPENRRLDAFFRCWTRKEAYLKARGLGLSAGLDRFEVSLASGEPARLLHVDPTDSGKDWHMYDVPPRDGYMAACVVERAVENLAVFDWSPLPQAGQRS